MKQQSKEKTFKTLRKMKQQAASLIDDNTKPGKISSLGGFIGESVVSFFYILKEKENITFAILQWLSIIGAYYLWVQFLGWIPEELWEAAANSKNTSSADLLLLLWSFLCVGLASMPIGILTACMGASQLLSIEGRDSTIIDCLKCVLPKIWQIWLFSWFDGWVTVERILDRLPKKNDRRTLAEKLIMEAAYQGWKLASLGFIPALVSGRTVKEACADSLNLAAKRFLPLAKLRLGYSMICWIIGISCYLSLYKLFPLVTSFAKSHGATEVYSFYVIAGLPMIAALMILMVFVRPLYIISAARIYADYTDSMQIKRNLPASASKIAADWLILIALIAIVWGLVCIKDTSTKVLNDPNTIIEMLDGRQSVRNRKKITSSHIEDIDKAAKKNMDTAVGQTE